MIRIIAKKKATYDDIETGMPAIPLNPLSIILVLSEQQITKTRLNHLSAHLRCFGAI